MATPDLVTAPYVSLLHSKDYQYLLAERPFGTNIYKSNIPAGQSGPPSSNVYAVKVIPVHAISSRKPHSARKEIATLMQLSHPNIAKLVSAFYDSSRDTHELVLPFFDLPLNILLDHPYFSAHSLPGGMELLRYGPFADLSPQIVYGTLTKSILYQIITAISYLHTQSPPIAHRDLNPGNILITRDGLAKIIDFGVVWNPGKAQLRIIGTDETIDDWEEDKDDMCSQIATGPFRAPELMYSPKQYDACATDLWALGITTALFFAPLKLEVDSDESSTDSDSDSDEKEFQFLSPYILPRRLSNVSPESNWRREALFDAGRGEIALLWSIFRVLGTPTKDSWPDFPGNNVTSAIRFRETPRQDIAKLLPHLPVESGPLEIIEGFLAYPPEQRLKASTAVSHPWFNANTLLLLPEGYQVEKEMEGKYVNTINGKSIPDILGSLIQEEERKFNETANLRDEWD